MGIPKSLAELGVKEEDSVLADNALKDVCGLTNPIHYKRRNYTNF